MTDKTAKEIKQWTGSDSRFYYDGETVNKYTKAHQDDPHYFPSATHILSAESPEDPGLTHWKATNTNWRDLLEHSALVGTFVHDTIEMMILNGPYKLISSDETPPKKGNYRIYPNEFKNEDITFVNRCLLGFTDWVDQKLKEDPEFKIIGTEKRIISDGYAGTMDLLVDYKREKDKVRKKYVVDFKTSKQVSKKHEIQVEAYRKAVDADLGIVLRLGSQRANCSNFQEKITLTKKKQGELWAEFKHLMNGYYLHNKGKVKPFAEPFPEVYTIDTNIFKPN